MYIYPYGDRSLMEIVKKAENLQYNCTKTFPIPFDLNHPHLKCLILNG